ncbi:carbohydrate ABC transporter permease [Acholeplasma laidlawii]|jgi:multiple sugar transport system permease protein|uniref:ABC-type transport system, permease component n=2 Tax=Acholeplasma laidlawii TaxID=2148 RepID=A9NE42_ACHLI|nr:carbohydrate ABC transporter permease [Acholeplasma laidlawii]ABX82002.1 ABC-type transport system, permease component [Acholeplasma laidlawii PG-8A]NWH10983.1 carbohydrate ABC transporter permease [Acholeplasma laidlawii]NWH12369.1 carbohydrate ABC transporter permease [Acholeplasma laidlawii]NWH13755.1 carbohydrate ABC transporter permease [Acholeplasma laidlawii]NWH14923.1 carbohydrate ABC transporter permease [Acholeplasma laidlawii]
MTANANFKVDYKVNQKLKAQKSATFLGKFGIYLFLAIMSIIVIIPFYWMLNVSLQGTDEVLNSLNVSLFPKDFSPKNYINVFFYTSSTTNINFPRYLTNTLVVAVFSTVGGTIFSIIVAFALARLNFKGKDLIFTILLATMMIPGEMMVISNFVTVAKFGWVDAQGVGSYLAMIVPFMVSIFHIYLLRQTFKQIPNELYYAAKVDGCGDFKYLVRVMVPMAKSSIITIVILKLMGTWNAYIWPNLVAHEEYRLVTTWLRGSFIDQAESGVGRPLLNYQMAATVIVTVPLLLLFIFFRKYIMSGVSRSGVKG